MITKIVELQILLALGGSGNAADDCFSQSSLQEFIVSPHYETFSSLEEVLLASAVGGGEEGDFGTFCFDSRAPPLGKRNLPCPNGVRCHTDLENQHFCHFLTRQIWHGNQRAPLSPCRNFSVGARQAWLISFAPFKVK